MEDLRHTRGVKMADRRAGLDFQHARLVMEELATFHAFSWIYKQRYNVDRISKIHPEFVDTMFSQSELSEKMKPMMEGMVNRSMEMIDKKAPFYEPALKLFESDAVELSHMFLSSDGVDWNKVEDLLRVKSSPVENGM